MNDVETIWTNRRKTVPHPSHFFRFRSNKVELGTRLSLVSHSHEAEGTVTHVGPSNEIHSNSIRIHREKQLGTPLTFSSSIQLARVLHVVMERSTRPGNHLTFPKENNWPGLQGHLHRSSDLPAHCLRNNQGEKSFYREWQMNRGKTDRSGEEACASQGKSSLSCKCHRREILAAWRWLDGSMPISPQHQ